MIILPSSSAWYITLHGITYISRQFWLGRSVAAFFFVSTEGYSGVGRFLTCKKLTCLILCEYWKAAWDRCLTEFESSIQDYLTSLLDGGRVTLRRKVLPGISQKKKSAARVPNTDFIPPVIALIYESCLLHQQKEGNLLLLHHQNLMQNCRMTTPPGHAFSRGK